MSARETRGRSVGRGAAMLVFTLAGGCGRKAPPPTPPPPEVAVLVVAPATVAESYDFSGEVVPFRRVEVRARVDGIIEQRPFTEGALVRPGQVLYRLDRVRYEAAYRSALARYQNAKQTYERIEPLLAVHAIAQQDLDNARSQLDAALAALDAAKKDLDDTVVRAEIAGRVGRTQLDLGARVTGPADILTTIDQLDPVYVSFRPTTQQLLTWRQDPRARALIQPGGRLAVRVTLPDGTRLPRTGTLNYVSPAADPQTGTEEFRALFTNPDRLLVPGQFVRVQLTGFSREAAIALPQRAVQQALGRQFVYLVGPGDTVITRDIVPGPWSGALWIIDRGLAPGDRVIVDGSQKIAPGRVVKPVPLADSAARAAPAAGAAR